eukprot:scaffold221850_cov14-Tisochrysis_lutea.AAC.1
MEIVYVAFALVIHFSLLLWGVIALPPVLVFYFPRARSLISCSGELFTPSAALLEAGDPAERHLPGNHTDYAISMCAFGRSRFVHDSREYLGN